MYFTDRKKDRLSNQARGCLLALLTSLTPAAFAACAELPPSSISVVRLESQPSRNFDYSYKTLRNLSEDHTRRDIEVLGLTRGLAVARFAIKGTVAKTQDERQECASFSLRLEYGFSPLTIYVSKEFPPGSCAHDEIYRHELRHVDTYREHARKIEAEITEALKRRFERASPWRNSAGESSTKLQKEIDERWIPYITRLLNKVNIEHRAIDSAEEYARVATSCNGEIRQRISGKR